MKQKSTKMGLTFCLLLFTLVAFAQQRTVTGKVIEENGSPIPNASVTVKGTNTGTMTNAEGNFSIQVPGNTAVLVISAVNHKAEEIQVGASSDFTVVLPAVAGSLKEVVVTALGIQKQKASLGYAVQEISGNSIVDAHETNTANALSGKISGLQVVRGSNGAGGSSKLVLRGYNSLGGDNQPLIVVDGIPMENFSGADNNDFFNSSPDYGNGIGDINPDDIASISVLKGQSAAALYGARGGNGVIMITTKTGRRQSGLGLSVFTTLSMEDMFMRPEIQNSFGQGDNNIFKADVNTSWGPKIEGQTVTKWDGTQVPLKAYDNLSAFLRKGTSQNYGISLQQQFGGTAVYSSISYLEDRSIFPGNKLTRTNLTSRVTSKFGKNDKWVSDVKLSYNNTQGYNRPVNGKDRSSIYAILNLPRSMDITDFEDGVNEFGKMLWYPGALAWTPNPYWMYRNNLNQDVRNRFLLNGSLKYNFTNWLSLEARAGADIYSMNTEHKVYAGGPLNNSYSTGKQNFIETNYSAMLNAKKDELFGKIGGAIMLGGNLMNHEWSSLGVSAGSLEVPDLFSPTNAQGNPSISAGYQHKKINSVYGSLELNYDKWLYLTFTDRNDWSSALISANRSYSYPSVGVSYLVTEMLQSMGSTLPNWIDLIKLRGSYASVGNDMGAYRLYNGYIIGKDPLNHTVASKETLLKNPYVKNELLKSLEFGAEMRFLSNRLGIDFTWYKSNATNQLIELPLDPMSGYSNKIINAGDIQNKGVEITADARILQNPNGLSWNMKVNYSANRNLVVDIAKDSGVTTYRLGTFDNFYIKATNGELYGAMYGTKFKRVDDASSPYNGEVLLDADGLPTATGESYYLGNQSAKALVGVINSFSYKNFDLTFQVDGRFGGKIFSATQAAMQANGTAAITAPGGDRPMMVVDGVISDGGGGFTKNTVEVTQQEYWNRIATSGNVGIGEANIYDATNVRLRMVMLGYTLPKNILSNVFQKARVSVSCNNVWMITSHVRGIDPESVYAIGTNAVGFESGAYPTMRTFQFSLNLGF